MSIRSLFYEVGIFLHSTTFFTPVGLLVPEILRSILFYDEKASRDWLSVSRTILLLSDCIVHNILSIEKRGAVELGTRSFIPIIKWSSHTLFLIYDLQIHTTNISDYSPFQIIIC